jgi:hypothetical protein
MAEQGRSDADPKRLHERARRAVFGHLGPAILHETNNVLTVMAGIRQILKTGAPVADRIGAMIDEQLTRMDRLIASIRRIGPDDVLVGEPRRMLSAIVEALEQVVKIAAKGRGVNVERGELFEAEPADGEALALASLVLVLPLFPPRGASGASRLKIGGRASARSVTVSLAFTPLREPPFAEDEALARALLASAGGSCEVKSDASGFVAGVVVPAAKTERDA